MVAIRILYILTIFLLIGGSVAKKSQECEECDFAVDMMHKAWGENTTEECVGELAYYICSIFQIEDHFVCKLIITDFAPEVEYILGQIIFEPHQICGLLLDNCGKFFDPFNATWHLPMPPNKPATVEKKPVAPGRPTLRVLHLTDLHMDMQYVVGSEADCPEPQCCRPGNDTQELQAATVKRPAGYWGTVGNCDVPYWTFDNMMQFIQKNHKDLDYVVVSGDLMSHAVYDYTQQTHSAMIKNVSDTMRNYLGKTPVYFAVGNHEGVPIDNFAPHFAPKQYRVDTNGLYDTMADSWKGWVPDNQMNIVKFRACFMVQLYDGLRLLSINNPLGGDQMNFWMYMNQTDPDETLQWVMDQLSAAEAVGDKVHIVAHIPGGNGEALEGWAINYYNVINRFENTIVAQFFGHTHSDEFYIAYADPNDYTSRPTHMIYSAPSVTTYSEYFPAYRIYTVDGSYRGSTYQVVDYEEWFMNLTEANANPGSATWKQMFSSINTELGLNSQLPSEWNNLIERMKTDDTLFQKYMTIRARRNSYDGLGTCDTNCKKGNLCSARQFHHEASLCTDIYGNSASPQSKQASMYKKPSKFNSNLTKLDLIGRFNQHQILKNGNCKF